MEETRRRVVASMLAMQRHPWEQGVCAQALYEAGLEEYWVPMARDAVQRQAEDGRLAMVGGGVAVSDPASCGEVCLRAWERTGEALYQEGAQRMLDYLLHRAPRTPDGIICHNEASFDPDFSAQQLWIDGLYMVPPFLAAMGCLEEAGAQLAGYVRHLRDPETGVFFHIKDVGQQRFVRKKRWATGNGWALLGMIRVAEAAERQGCADMGRGIPPLAASVLRAMLRYQLPDGRFHDLLDEPDSFVDGTSGLMMAAAVFRGVAAGCLPDFFVPAAERAFQAASAHIDEWGLLHEVCGCPDFLRVGTSAEAQAAWVMAVAWRERLKADPGC